MKEYDQSVLPFYFRDIADSQRNHQNQMKITHLRPLEINARAFEFVYIIQN